MAINSTTNRVSFSGDGSTTAFSFPHPIQSSADLKVLLMVTTTEVETLQTITTHYTFSGTAVNGVYPNGGSITFLSAPANTKKVIIYREPVLSQGLDLVENDAMPAESVEQALDRRALIEQRLNELATRSVRLPDGVTASFDPKLPKLLASNPSATLIINAAGDGLDIGPTATQVSTAEASAIAAAASAGSASSSASSASSSASAASASASAASASATLAASNTGWNVTGSFASPTGIAGAGAVAFTAAVQRSKLYVQGSGGAQTVGSFQAGTTDGQEMLLVGCSDTDLLTIDSPTRCITKGTLILGANDRAYFEWDHGSTTWVEVSRNN